METKPTSIQQKSTATKVIQEVRKISRDRPLSPDNEVAMMTETEQDDREGVAETGPTDGEINEDDDSEYNDEDDEDNWVPPTASSSNRNKTPKANLVIQCQLSPFPSPSRGKTTRKVTAERNRLSKLEQKVDDLFLDDPNDSVVILPATKSKARQRSSTNDEIDDDDVEIDISAAKKKKR